MCIRDRDIIHRDIKPQNIMVQPDGNVKVMDFGIARAKNSVMTQTSSVLGTAHYISPEQAQGKDLTATSDIYSLGIVLYESATGRLPFDGPDAVSVAMKDVYKRQVPTSAPASFSMERKRLMNGFPFSKALPRSRKICTEGPERNPGPQIVCRPGGREAISRGFGNLLCGDFHTVQQLSLIHI